MDLIVNIVLGIIVAATPLVFASIGELVVEKSGVLNLGVEGMMIIGAIAGFAGTIETGSFMVGILAAIIAGAAVALLFAVLTQTLLANQVATGLALTLFGLGLAALIGQSYSGKSAPDFPKLNIPGLTDLPIIGPLIFGQDGLVYLSFALVAGVAWVLTRTRTGLIIRAIGENHDAAHAIGYPVVAYRYATLLFGGACAGLGGAYLSIVQTPLWVENMTAGRGWIALALVVFAAWRPWRSLLGAYLFGGITIIQLHSQALGLQVEPQILAMLPYLATIIVLVLISYDKAKARLNAPANLGKTFFAST
ncbi:MAG: ABC transporter permease [Hyphomicrobiales bacterium]|nr:ABC transporter permease [Hyphomicrobiales bacterium]